MPLQHYEGSREEGEEEEESIAELEYPTMHLSSPRMLWCGLWCWCYTTHVTSLLSHPDVLLVAAPPHESGSGSSRSSARAVSVGLAAVPCEPPEYERCY